MLYRPRQYGRPHGTRGWSIASIAGHVPWGLLYGPGIAFNQEGSFMATFRVRGHDLDSSSPADLAATAQRFADAMLYLGDRWAMHAEVQRHAIATYPATDMPDPVTALVDAERGDHYERPGVYFEPRQYITFTYLPPQDVVARTHRFLIANAPHGDVDYARELEAFEHTIARIADQLVGAFHTVERLIGEAFLTYLHSTVSTRWHPVGPFDTPAFLSYLLPDQHLRGGMYPQLGDDHLRVVGVKGMPAASWPEMHQAIAELPFPLRLSVRYVALSPETALRLFKKQWRRWFSMRKGIVRILMDAFIPGPGSKDDPVALARADEADAAREAVANGLLGYGYLTVSVVVWHPDLATADHRARLVEQILTRRGFIAVTETFNAVEAWAGTLPGNLAANVRRPVLSTLNAAHFIPLSQAWTGPDHVDTGMLSGPPLFHATSQGNTVFRATLAEGDVRHTLVIGGTGGGKSTLLGFIGLQFARYHTDTQPAQVYVIESGRAGYVSTHAAGGVHYHFGDPTRGLSLQPLRNVDTPADAEWAHGWLATLLRLEGLAVEPRHQQELWGALTALADQPVGSRTMTMLVRLVQDRAIKAALAPYAEEGPYAPYLDGSDAPPPGPRATFEMSEILDQPVAKPLLLALFRYLHRQFRDGAPTVLMIDEAWLALDDPILNPEIRKWLVTLRKLNVGVVLSTQTIADVVRSPIAQQILSSCPTRIYLPNPEAESPEVRHQYEAVGLSARQIELIASAVPKRHYYVVSPSGARLIDLELDEVALAFCAAGSRADLDAASHFLREHAPGPDFAAAWLRHKGLFDAAETVEAISSREEAA
jgi:type IV secretion system protein VirB4